MSAFRALHPWTWVAERETGGGRRGTKLLGQRDALYKELYRNVKHSGSWNPASASEDGQHGAVFNFDFSKDGAILAAACERKSLLLFDPLSHKHIRSVHSAHSDCINYIRFLDTRVFATCSDDTTVALWDVRYLKSKLRLLEGHSNWVKNIEYAQDKGLLVTSGFDGSIYAWNINSYSETESAPFRRLFHMSGLMRMKLTPDSGKLVVATAGGYLMVVHDLDLHTVGNDLHGFKPNMYRLMQMSHSPIRQGYTFNHLFHKSRRRNRVEFISDFPSGNDAEVIASLQIDPSGHFALSRNTSSDDNSEWTCVHDIWAPPSDEADPGCCPSCGREYPEERTLDPREEELTAAFSSAAARRLSVDEDEIVPETSASQSPFQRSCVHDLINSLYSFPRSTDDSESSSHDRRDRSPLDDAGESRRSTRRSSPSRSPPSSPTPIRPEVNEDDEVVEAPFAVGSEDQISELMDTDSSPSSSSSSGHSSPATVEDAPAMLSSGEPSDAVSTLGAAPNLGAASTSGADTISGDASTSLGASTSSAPSTSLTSNVPSTSSEASGIPASSSTDASAEAQIFVSSNSLLTLTADDGPGRRGHFRLGLRNVTQRTNPSNSGRQSRTTRQPTRVVISTVNGQRVTIIRRGRAARSSAATAIPTAISPSAVSFNSSTLSSAAPTTSTPAITPRALSRSRPRTFQIRSGAQPSARTVLLLNRNSELDVDSISTTEDSPTTRLPPRLSRDNPNPDGIPRCSCQPVLCGRRMTPPLNSRNKTIHDNRPRLAYFEEESNIGKGFIKELCFSSDGRLVCSPFGYGVRLFSFDEACSQLDAASTPPTDPRRLCTLSNLVPHTNTVVCTKWSPTHCLFVSACLNGKVAFNHPVL